MPAFLELPIEVRSMIIKEVIHAECDPRVTSSKASDYAQKFDLFQPDQTPSWTIRDLWFEAGSRNYITTAYGLMATNKQLYHETTPILQKATIIYKVDIGFMQGRMLWPTWTSLPKKTDVVDVIQATVQLRGSGKPCFSGFNMNRVCRDFATQEESWRQHMLFESLLPFIAQGPQRDRDNENWFEGEIALWTHDSMPNPPPCPIVVKVLDIDFIEPDECYLGHPHTASRTEKCMYCGDNCGYLWRLGGRTGRPTAHDVYESVLAPLDSLTRFLGDTRLSRLFYTSVGNVRIRLNGVVKVEIDLTGRLMRMPNQWDGQELSPWRKNAIQLKRDKGLVAVGNVAQEDKYDLYTEIMQAF